MRVKWTSLAGTSHCQFGIPWMPLPDFETPYQRWIFLDSFSSVYRHLVLDAHITSDMVNKNASAWEDLRWIWLSLCVVDPTCSPHYIVFYRQNICPGIKWSFLNSWSSLVLFFIVFTLLGRIWPFPNSQVAHLGLSKFAAAFEFPCTLRLPVWINHCPCLNPIFPSLKCHWSSSFYEVVRFWLASLVAQTTLVSYLNSLSIWFGIISSWFGSLFFCSYSMVTPSTGAAFCQPGVYTFKLNSA